MGAAAAFPALRFAAGNVSENPSWIRLLVATAALLVIGVSATVLGGERRKVRSTVVAAALIMLVSYGGLVQTGLERILRSPMVAWSAMGVLASATVILAWRAATASVVQGAVIFVATAMLVGPGGQAALEVLALRDQHYEIEPITLGRVRPDVVVVVTDTMGSMPVLAEQFGIDTAEFADALGRAGFFVEGEAPTNYPWTYLSLASFLSLDYPKMGGEKVEPADVRRMYRMIGGDNLLAASLKHAGYRYVHVEGGWSGSRCGWMVDICVRAPFVDDTLWPLIDNSIFRTSAISAIGHAYTGAVRRQFELVPEILATARTDGRPTYVFVHMMLPHPPLYFGESCEFKPDSRLGFVPSFNEGEVDYEDRLAAYGAQVRCLQHFLESLFSGWPLTDPTLVLVTGDHGVHRGEATLAAKDWRLSNTLQVLTTTRLVRGSCHALEDGGSLVNEGRRILRCLGAELPDVVDRYFAVDPGPYPRQVRQLPDTELPPGWT